MSSFSKVENILGFISSIIGLFALYKILIRRDHLPRASYAHLTALLSEMDTLCMLALENGHPYSQNWASRLSQLKGEARAYHIPATSIGLVAQYGHWIRGLSLKIRRTRCKTIVLYEEILRGTDNAQGHATEIIGPMPLEEPEEPIYTRRSSITSMAVGHTRSMVSQSSSRALHDTNSNQEQGKYIWPIVPRPHGRSLVIRAYVVVQLHLTPLVVNETPDFGL